MGGPYRHGRVRKKKVSRKGKKAEFPKVFVDQDLDFASIKLSSGIEARSYEKEGFVFCEDARGRIIEVQILNLSHWITQKEKMRSAA